MKKFLLGLFALVICATGIALGDYTATQGSGTTFGSAVVSTVHYVRNLLCDPTTVTQCAAVNSSGVVSVSVSNTNANGQATMANSSPVVMASDQSAIPVTLGAVATGGATAYTPFVPTASDNHQTVKNGAGTVYSFSISNNSATKNYARLYDLGTGFNGCNSATGVIFAFEIPPTDGGFSIQPGGANGMAFSTGLSLCITSGFGLTDTTNATATAMYVNVAYK